MSPKKLGDLCLKGVGGTCEAEDSKMAIEKEESAADRSFGKFNVKRWPEDLDEFFRAKMKESWGE